MKTPVKASSWLPLSYCLLISLSLFATLLSCSAPSPSESSFLTESANTAVADYLLKVEDSFGIKAVKSEHQQTLAQEVKAFEQDLASANVDNYYQNPKFSILLAAGSEGNFFNSKEGIEVIGKTGAVFARAVIFDPGQPPKSFTGQFSNGRFFFGGKDQPVFSPLNTTYLISLDLNLDTKIFQGQLVAGSEGNFIRPGEGLPAELAAGSEGNFLRAPSPSEIADKLKTYQSVLQRNLEQGRNYARQVNELKFVAPEFPLGLAWTETFARLIRAYPDEMGLALERIRGLPPRQLDKAWLEVMARQIDRYQADCGYPPPDSGKLYPQKLAEVSPIPQGWQSEALDKVIADLPALASELQELMKLEAPQRVVPFLQLLTKYQASNPEVFARHAWTDEFAPPECVKPRRRPRPAPAGSPDGATPPLNRPPAPAEPSSAPA